MRYYHESLYSYILGRSKKEVSNKHGTHTKYVDNFCEKHLYNIYLHLLAYTRVNVKM